MKIGIFTETYRPTINGVVVSIDTFKEQLEQKGHEYFIFCPANPKQSEPDLKNIYRFPSLTLPDGVAYPLAKPMSFSQASQLLPLDLISQLDIIHVQHYAMMGQYGLRCAREFHIPCVYTYHTMAELYTSYVPIGGVLARPLIRFWTRHTAKQADHIVTPTHSVKEYLQNLGIDQPISIIPTGIETKNYKRTPKAFLEQQFKIPVHHDILLYVGRLAVEKNIDFLLKAYLTVQRLNPDVHLILAGDGPDRTKCERFIAQHGLSRHVTVIGFLPHREIVKVFGAVDLFVFPSITDTQGIVIIEAMAAGTVPVAINRLGPHDIIKDNLTGRLSDLNSEEFSGIILDLLHHPDKRQQLAIAARHQAKQFDTAVTAAAMEKLYARLANHHRSK